MKNKNIVIKIKDIDWTFVLLTSRSYHNKHGTDSGAITIPDERTVHFDKSELSMDNIYHELFHVFVDCSQTGSANLDKEQMEELGATIVQDHIHDILKYAQIIMDKFLQKEEV